MSNLPEEKIQYIDWALISVCLFFAAALTYWFYLDHSLPFWDAASHVQDSAKYAELYRHFAPWRIKWWHAFLTENFCYPLTIHAFTGFLMLIFGCSRQVVDLSMIIFATVLNASIYGITKFVFKDRLAAVLSVLFINSYVIIGLFIHMPMLDLPLVSFHCLGMLALLWWLEKPTWQTTALTSLAMMLALTSKQNAAFFFIVPCFLLWLYFLFNKRKTEVAQLSVIGAMSALSLLLWVVPNYAAMKKFVVTPATGGESTTFVEIFARNFYGFLISIPGMMSPVLFCIFLLALLVIAKSVPKLMLPIVGAASGFLLLSCVGCQAPEARYIDVVLVVPAIITGLAIARCLRHKIFRIPAAIIVVFTVGLFIAFNYYPYPISGPVKLFSTLKDIAGKNFTMSVGQALEPSSNPTPAGDVWGQEWVIKTIAESEKGRTCWLNVMPSTPELNVHTFELLALYQGVNVRPSTLRVWALKGDHVVFDEQALSYFDWFLLKTGEQGLHLDGEQSMTNYKKIEDYVREKFTLQGKHKIADGSELSLFNSRH